MHKFLYLQSRQVTAELSINNDRNFKFDLGLAKQRSSFQDSTFIDIKIDVIVRIEIYLYFGNVFCKIEQ